MNTIDRCKITHSDDKAAKEDGGFFLYHLENMLHMERNHTESNRRQTFRDTPSWNLFFKNSYYNKAQTFVYQTIAAMSAVETHPILNVGRTFHSETGRVARALVDYLRSIEDSAKSLLFLADFRAYAAGRRKTMPRKVKGASDYCYDLLKTVAKPEYTQRLNAEHHRDPKAGRTQDIVVLFKIPLYPLLETIALSDNDQDVLQAIDDYR